MKDEGKWYEAQICERLKADRETLNLEKVEAQKLEERVLSDEEVHLLAQTP